MAYAALKRRSSTVVRAFTTLRAFTVVRTFAVVRTFLSFRPDVKPYLRGRSPE
jgi:hypothetical protein